MNYFICVSFHISSHTFSCQATISHLSVLIIFTMIFEFFKIWDGIPALYGVSSTISIAGEGLMSFSLVLGCLVTLFAGAAMLAFGQKVTAFHDMSSAIIQTLILMSSGDPEVYTMLLELNPLIASIWYWLLICVMYLVCLNLVLCILVDAYAEANTMVLNHDDHIPTLLEQGSDTAKHLLLGALPMFKLKKEDGSTTENSDNDSSCDRGDITSSIDKKNGGVSSTTAQTSSRPVAWAPDNSNDDDHIEL